MPTDNFEITESDLVLPASDRRDAIAKEIDEICRELIEVTHKLHDESNERMIGRLEERWFTLRREIINIQERAYLDEGIYIAVATTADCLPIRVNKVRKVTPWGRAAV